MSAVILRLVVEQALVLVSERVGGLTANYDRDRVDSFLQRFVGVRAAEWELTSVVHQALCAVAATDAGGLVHEAMQLLAAGDLPSPEAVLQRMAEARLAAGGLDSSWSPQRPLEWLGIWTAAHAHQDVIGAALRAVSYRAAQEALHSELHELELRPKWPKASGSMWIGSSADADAGRDGGARGSLS